MRLYIDRYLFGIGIAVAVVLALCLAWPVDYGVTQADDGAILTVGACIGASARGDSLQEVLIEKGVIEEDLLQTRVTSGMCKDMLDSGGTPAQSLVAAQNYVQEIELIEGAMKEAAGETATRVPARGSPGDEPLNLFRTIAYADERAPALAQYDEPEDGGGAEVVDFRTRQAAAAASVGEDADAPIADRLDQKEAALREAGASAPEAAAGGRCSLEVDVPDEELKSKGLYEINPDMPDEMGHGKTKHVGLLVSPMIRERLREIKRKRGAIAEASEYGIGCVELTDRMKARVIPEDPTELDVDQQQPDDIRELSSNRDTVWSWDITARQTGELSLLLDLSYTISRGDQEFRLVPNSPIYDGEIEVTSHQGDSTQKSAEQPWWRRILDAILGLFGA